MSPCTDFAGAISHSGYGNMIRNGRQVGAHRAAYEDAFGPIPAGLVVRHTCDNKRCINPEHLVVGTQRDNIQDAKVRGRLATGERHGSRTHPERILRGAAHPRGNAKLSPEQVRVIRSLAGLLSQRAIAERFEIGQSQVSRIVRGVRWEVI